MGKKEKYPVMLLAFGIIVLFVCVCVTNLFHFNYKMNADIAAEPMLAQVMWETKELHPDIWYFDSEARIFGTLDFAALFYGLTHNMVLSQGLACCVMTALLLLGIFWFGKVLGWTMTERLLFLFMSLALPVSPLVLELIYFFCCYYGLHTLVFFLTLGVYAKSIRHDKADLRGMAACVLFAFCMGVQGMRGMLVTYGPLFGMEVIRILYRCYCRSKSRRSDKFIFLWTVVLLAVNFLGTLLPISIGHGFSRNIRNGFAKLYSIVIPEMIRSIGFSQVGVIGKFCLIVLLLILAWILADILWRMCRKQEISLGEWCFLVICSSPIVTALMVAFTTVESSIRYYYIILYAMAYAVLLTLRKLRSGRRRYCAYGISLLLAVFAVISVITVYWPILRSEEPPRDDWYYTVQYLEENGVTRAYSTFANAGTMTVISNGRVQMAAVDSVAKMNACRWQGRQDWYVPNVPFEEKTAYVIPDSEMQSFAEFLARHEDDVIFAKQVGRFFIYISDYNYSYMEE